MCFHSWTFTHKGSIEFGLKNNATTNPACKLPEKEILAEFFICDKCKCTGYKIAGYGHIMPVEFTWMDLSRRAAGIPENQGGGYLKKTIEKIIRLWNLWIKWRLENRKP
jgi:hypothetical protein